MTKVTYIVMDAPGFYGDYATVWSRHDDLPSAIHAGGLGSIVSDDGGYAETHQPGSKIHGKDAARYRVHWSASIAAARYAAQDDRRDAVERERRAAERYGRGSAQYLAALDWK
jgi:hypothetical protein